MRLAELLEWIFGTTETALTESDVVTLSNPSAHVDIASAHDETTYPFVGVRLLTINPVTQGLGNASLVPQAIATDENGHTTAVSEVLRRDFTIEIVPVVNDDPYKRDQLTDTLSLAFAQHIEANETPSDVSEASVGAVTPSDRAESFVRANGVEFTGRLHTASERALPTVESYTLDVDVTSDDERTDAYPEQF